MKEIDSFKNYCNEHNVIFCYGAGLYGKTISAYLKGIGRDIDGFIVSDISNNKKIHEHRVYSIEEFKQIYNPEMGIIVGVGLKYRNQIIEVLSEYKMDDFICVSDELISYMQENGNFEYKYKSDNNVTVLCFHRVIDAPLDTWKIMVRNKLFEKELEYLKKNYILLRADGNWEIPENRRGAVITFDDGYEDAYTNILPLLEKHDIPATFFISTGNLNTSDEFWWDELERIIFCSRSDISCIDVFGEKIPIETIADKEAACYKIHPILKKMSFRERNEWLARMSRLMGSKKRNYCHSLNYEQLKKLSESSLVTIGGHTITHSCLAEESYEEQRWEIVESKKKIEELIGKRIEVFSYPFGQRDDFTDETVEIAKEVGYKRIFTAYAGVAGRNSINGYIPRINIGKEPDYDSAIRKLTLYENIYGD